MSACSPPSARSRRRCAARRGPRATELNGILNVLTCGSVDDGKSTLIGRMLWDASDLLRRPARDAREVGRAPPAGTHPTSACWSTASSPSASRASPSTSPGATSTRRHARARHHRQPRPRTVHAQHGDRRLARRRRHPAGRRAPRREARRRGGTPPSSTSDGRASAWSSPSTRWTWSTGRRRTSAPSRRTSAS